MNGTWQRIQFSTTASNYQFDVNTYSGATARTIWLWGAQLELGSTATTYQPVATTASTIFASQFKYNLKDPRNLDAAFRQVFNGGWTYSKQGATPNGTNGYADTKLVPNTNLTLNSASFSVYSRNDFTPTANQSWGCDSSGIYVPLIGATMLPSKSLTCYAYNYNSPDVLASATGQNLAAMFITTRTSSSNAKLFRNTTQLAAVTTQGQTTQPTNSFTFGAFRNGSGFQDYNTFQTAFAHIGDGLTDSEASAMYTSVQSYQISMARQV